MRRRIGNFVSVEKETVQFGSGPNSKRKFYLYSRKEKFLKHVLESYLCHFEAKAAN